MCYTTLLVTLVATGVASSDLAALDIDFNRDVRPILSDKCFACHGPDQATVEADLRLDDEASVKRDRDGYVVVQPGDPDASEMIRRITSADEFEIMPPPETNKPLSRREIETLRRWIAAGAPWAQHWAYVMPAKSPIPVSGGRQSPDTVSRSRTSHSDRTIRGTDVPRSPEHVLPRNWIDNFILARLEREGVAPSPEADRVTLMRRIAFDLTGLPPTPEMAGAFLEDASDEAYGRLVDGLLHSPHYGERMAMYWLDLVRYADTVGYHGDQVQNIWPYRDWVIDAFNDNLPFDQFTREQLAGDLLPEPTQDQRIATGYNRLLQTTHEGGLQPKEYRAIYAADRVRNVSAVWFGATIGCAQCHDHKFDPYTAKDFYSLAAFFADVDDEKHFTAGSNTNPTSREPELLLPTDEQRAQLDEITARMQSVQCEVDEALKAEGLTEEEQKQLKQRVSKVASELKRAQAPVLRSMITAALEEPREVRILPRGNWLDESGPIVQPAIPEFLGTLSAIDGRGSRLDLANWLFDTEDGIGLLTARVMVNRLWYLCFSSGLAGDLDDFGGQGEPPVHPELLDHLAHEFVESGWDMRAMLKLIVTSRTYRQSSIPRPDLADVDPRNRLYARQSAYRLPAEMIRDNALAVSGLLVRDIGGESVKPYQPEGYYRHLNFPTRTYQQHNDERQWRRGLYVHWQRQFLHPMLKAFDAPSREECTAQRPRSNTPLAALTLLNDPTFVEAARAFAARIQEADAATDADRLKWAFHQATTRHPTGEEMAVLQQLLDENRSSFSGQLSDAGSLLSVGLVSAPKPESPELAAWAEVCRAILNLAETNTRD